MRVCPYLECKIAIGMYLLSSLALRNIGKSPALNYRANAALLAHRPTSIDDITSFLNSSFSTLKKETEEKEKLIHNARGDLAPDAIAFFTRETTPLASPDIRDLKAGTLWLFYIGGATYLDITQNPAYTEFCWIYFGEDAKTWHICDNHNIIR